MPPGATVGTQMYWFEAPEPQAPWKDAAELNEYLTISHRVGAHCTITPRHMSLRAPGQKPLCTVAVDDLRRGLDEQAETTGTASRGELRQQTHNIHTGITVDRDITPLSALNEVLINAGGAPLEPAEAMAFVDRVTKEAVPRLSSVMRRIAASRGLKLTGISVADMRKKRSRFSAEDVAEGGALLILDKEDPLFVVAFRKHEMDGQPPMLTLVSPTLDPKPYRRTVRVLNRIARFECDFYYVTKKDDDDSDDDDDGAAAEGVVDAEDNDSGAKRKRDGEDAGEADERLPTQRTKQEGVGATPAIASQSQTHHTNPQNPFARLPKLANQKMRRKNKRTKHTWRVRLIETAKRQELYDKAHLIADEESADDDDAFDLF